MSSIWDLETIIARAANDFAAQAHSTRIDGDENDPYQKDYDYAARDIASVLQTMQEEAGKEGIRYAAERIRINSERTDNRFTDHVVAEAGGIELLEEYAENYSIENNETE